MNPFSYLLLKCFESIHNITGNLYTSLRLYETEKSNRGKLEKR